MDIADAASVLSALSLAGRLEVFRLLVASGPAGLSAGRIEQATRAPASTLSANLKILKSVGLVEDRRDGRFIHYAARYDRMRDLLAFLVEDCCGGAPDVCAPLADIVGKARCSELPHRSAAEA